MSKERVPLGLRKRVPLKPEPKVEVQEPKQVTPPKAKKKVIKPKGRPSTKKGKKLMKYSMDIHPELKRAVVKAAAIYDKDVHLMWNEIVFGWLEKERKKNPDWFASIQVDKSEL